MDMRFKNKFYQLLDGISTVSTFTTVKSKLEVYRDSCNLFLSHVKIVLVPQTPYLGVSHTSVYLRL